MPESTSSRVLTLDTALFQVGTYRAQLWNALNVCRQSLEHGGFWHSDTDRTAFPWDPPDVLNFAYHLAQFDMLDLDELGNPKGIPNPGRFAIWIQPESGAGFVRHEWALLEGLRNNLEAYCLKQNKKRKRGTWFDVNKDDRNKMMIRVPHR